MNTYEIKNIKPSVNATNNVTGISFDLYATDTTGDVAEMSWKTQYATPLGTLDTFAAADLTTLCNTVITNNNMEARLDTILSNRKIVLGPGVDPSYVAPVVPLTDAQQRQSYMNEIDRVIALTYNRFQRFQSEYDQRETAARAFKAAGYTGDPTVWVSVFADNTGMTYQVAADKIISQSDSLRVSLLQLGELRMNKYKLLSAADLPAAIVEYNSIISQWNTIDTSLA